jgi:pyruvate dehydrogenase kinase 2/3/4
VSLRQLTTFGKKLTESRLLASANFVRTELPIRLAHRVRDMQKLPFNVTRNVHMQYVYNLYFRTFDTLRKIPEIKTMKQNDEFCKTLKQVLRDNLSVVPRSVIGILESQGKMGVQEADDFLTLLLKTRISRRVIAEQHLALTETFHSPFHFPEQAQETDVVGEVFSKLIAKEVVEECAENLRKFAKQAYGNEVVLPEVSIQGHLNATLTYITNQLEYIIGELLRNSFQAVIEQQQKDKSSKPSKIEVTICESPQNVIIRICDHGGGIARSFMPHLWSLSPGPRQKARLDSLKEFKIVEDGDATIAKPEHYDLSLSSFTTRPPNLRLGIGLPMSKIYAEYWAGKLEVHSLEGYGTDAFLQVSKLGNQNEQLSKKSRRVLFDYFLY